MTTSTSLGLIYERIRATRPCQLRMPFLTCGVAVAAAVVLCSQCGLRFNLTASLPIGLYIRSNASDTNLAEFCPPEPFSQISVERRYRRSGVCPDGDSPLLKPVVAKSGDVVVTSPSGIAVNGTLLPNTAPRDRDSKGLPLPHYAFGTYTVLPGFVWVASTYHPLSFDSRYFGPIPAGSVRERLKPILVF
jgi:conjugative transfer signal peptidase TraF